MGWMARRANLIVTEAGNDLVVYDERTSHLHTLPAPIAAVWRSCDGMATVDQIAIATGMTPARVDSALRQLREAGLIEGEPLADGPSGNRRTFIRKAALGAAIVSVTAPMAASASSVAPAGQCWFMDPGQDHAWVEVEYAPTYEECRALDSCHPGAGSPPGWGCYWWDTDPSTEPKIWR